MFDAEFKTLVKCIGISRPTHDEINYINNNNKIGLSQIKEEFYFR
jgi:hypothetical protein